MPIHGKIGQKLIMVFNGNETELIEEINVLIKNHGYVPYGEINVLIKNHGYVPYGEFNSYSKAGSINTDPFMIMIKFDLKETLKLFEQVEKLRPQLEEIVLKNV